MVHGRRNTATGGNDRAAVCECVRLEVGPWAWIGRVTRLEPRALVVEFPRSGTTLRLAANTDALMPVDLSPGYSRG